MKQIKINKLSAASRKRVTRRIYSQLRYLLSWYSEALASANAAEFDGALEEAAKWDAEAKSLREAFYRLEGTLS